jgi:hypothetical protein
MQLMGVGLPANVQDKRGACEDWMKSSELGCVQANILLPLCDEYMKEDVE